MLEQQKGIQVSEYNESADEFCDFLFDEINRTDGFRKLTEVKDWFEEVEKKEFESNKLAEDLKGPTPKNIYWISSDDPELPLGVGFVISPLKEVKEGIYFRDPDWYEGKVCRVNNQYDIALFILAAREIKELNESGRAFLSTFE